MLANRRVIVGVSGGIASYKAVELVSRLQQAGALVDVILTEHAEEFVRPLTFSTMSHRPVYSDLWEPSGKAAETHIELGEEAELLAVVPATANTIAKLAHGIADNMLTAVALATRAPLLLAPAMHHQMYTHPATQANLALLRERGAMVVEPEVGRLASGETGVGRLPDTPVLLGAISVALARGGDLAGRRVVITAGGTQEPIDPVRYVGNRSSGKMGYALAIEARDRGAHVTLISGPVALAAPYGVDVTTVETAAQMRDAVVAAVEGKGKGERVDVLIMSAAVADYRPAQVAARKLKKEGGQGAQLYQMGEAFSLELVRTPDILATLAAFGMASDEPVLVQSERTAIYADALQRLEADGHAYRCWCSRTDLECFGGIHPAQCVASPSSRPPAWRLRVGTEAIAFDDAICGRIRQDLAAEVGDFVVWRADGACAYQLAVVVDDAAQGISDVVRGADLLDSTPRQILLQRLLGLPQPRYAHLPLALDAQGRKLSKHDAAHPVDAGDPLPALRAALAFLGQPARMETEPEMLLREAVRAFDPARIACSTLPIAAARNATPR